MLDPVLYNYDRVADIYDSTRGLPAGAQEAVISGLASVLRERSADPRALEVGIGTGRIAAPLAERGLRISGVDISRKMLDRLTARAPQIPVMLAESGRLPFRPATFDAVLFVHVLHLFPDPGAALGEAVRTLTPGGCILIGRHGYSPSPLQETRALIDESVEEVTGKPLATPRRLRSTNQYEAHLARLGFITSEPRALAAWPDGASGRDVLTEVAERRNSNTWNIPDSALPEVIRILEPKLSRLLGGLEKFHHDEARFVLQTATQPSRHRRARSR